MHKELCIHVLLSFPNYCYSHPPMYSIVTLSPYIIIYLHFQTRLRKHQLSIPCPFVPKYFSMYLLRTRTIFFQNNHDTMITIKKLNINYYYPMYRTHSNVTKCLMNVHDRKWICSTNCILLYCLSGLCLYEQFLCLCPF